MLHAFPYYSININLSRLELHALEAVSTAGPLRRWAFIGSGPLPLTLICISIVLRERTHLGITCCNIERNQEAVRLSSRIDEALGMEDEKRCQCAHIGKDEVNLHGFDVICVAALVGETSHDKERITADVIERMRPGAMLVLRSAHSLRCLLYPVSIYSLEKHVS